MRLNTRKAAVAATGVLACTGTALGVGLTHAGADAHGRPDTVLRFVAHEEAGNMAFDDLGAPSEQGPDIGDVVAFTQRLTAHGRTVGRISNAAVGVDHRRHLFQASATVVLRHGRIEVAGLVSQQSRFQLAVVGGSGRYAGAVGTMDFANVHDQQRIVVTLRDR
jgi:allene oxide cyclase-like protein